MRDWERCPICGEPDMEVLLEDGGKIIQCTNLACASNGGDNATALLKKMKDNLRLMITGVK